MAIKKSKIVASLGYVIEKMFVFKMKSLLCKVDNLHECFKLMNCSHQRWRKQLKWGGAKPMTIFFSPTTRAGSGVATNFKGGA